MAQKNLMAQVAGFLKRTTTGELPAPELAQLSEEDLQQIVGGVGTEATAEVETDGPIKQKTRVASNVIVGQYTLEELIQEIINPREES